MGKVCHEYTNSEIRDLIREHLHSERDRKLLFRRLVDGITFEKLSEEFGLSPKQTRNIVHKCESVLFKHLVKE